MVQTCWAELGNDTGPPMNIGHARINPCIACDHPIVVCLSSYEVVKCHRNHISLLEFFFRLSNHMWMACYFEAIASICNTLDILGLGEAEDR